MAFIELIGNALGSLHKSGSVYRVRSIDEFLYEIGGKRVRKVDAFACMQQVGNQFFVEHFGMLPFMQYYVVLNSDTETGPLQLNEPVAQKILRSPPEIYPSNTVYSEQTLSRAKELVNMVNSVRPDIFTRLYGIDGKFIDDKR